MQLLYFPSWLPAELVRALCWTFIHSLWQGLLAAALAGLVIAFTRKSSARLRYNLFGAIMIFFIMGTAITFQAIIRQSHPAEIVTVTTNYLSQELPSFSESEQAIPAAASGFFDRMAAWLDEHSDFIVTLWFVLFFAHCIKLFFGIAGINRLSRQKIIEPAFIWQEQLNNLRYRMGIDLPVRLLESGLVRVPAAIGYFKPVILVPVGLLANIPVEQVETILLHELAHIRRKDYLINILQRIAEAVFFFNPALLWISSLIRQEREACCDDIVLHYTGDKGNYLEALVSFQEYADSPGSYAMAITRKKDHLLNRVKRMLTRENKKLGLMEKIILITGLLVVTAFTFIPQKNTEKQNPDNQPALSKELKEDKPVQFQPEIISKKIIPGKKTELKPIAAAVRDTVPVSREEKEKSGIDELEFPLLSITMTDDGKTRTASIKATDQHGKQYLLSREKDKITAFSIDGKPVPENEYSQYKEIIEKLEKAGGERRIERKKLQDERRAEQDVRRKEQMLQADEQRQEVKEMKMQRDFDQRKKAFDIQKKQLDSERKVIEQKQKSATDQYRQKKERQDDQMEKQIQDLDKKRKSLEKKYEQLDRQYRQADSANREIKKAKKKEYEKEKEENHEKKEKADTRINFSSRTVSGTFESFDFKSEKSTFFSRIAISRNIFSGKSSPAGPAAPSEKPLRDKITTEKKEPSLPKTPVSIQRTVT